MKRGVKVGISALVLLLVLAGVGLAFENEPEGFRGLKWGDPPGGNMEQMVQLDEFTTRYTLPEERLQLENVDLSAIRYQFFNDRFAGVVLFFRGKERHSHMKTICKGKFGEPTLTGFNVITWKGRKATVTLTYNSIGGVGFFSIASTPLILEWMEAKKKLETERAEGDW